MKPASPVGREVAAMLSAVQFLTRLPVPDPGWEAGRMRAASRYFGLVGAVVGAIAALVWLLAGFVLAPALAAGLALAAGVLVAGALHEDGLADTADGLGVHADRERRLEIMRDSRLGTFGVVALVVALGLRWAALAALAPEEGALALVLAASLGRALMVPAVALAPYARPEGLATGLGAGPAEIAPALLVPLALALVAGAGGVAALLVAAVAGAAVLGLLVARLGGHTGDGLGAIAAVAETAALVTLAGVWA